MQPWYLHTHLEWDKLWHRSDIGLGSSLLIQPRRRVLLPLTVKPFRVLTGRTRGLPNYHDLTQLGLTTIQEITGSQRGILDQFAKHPIRAILV